MMGPLLVLAMGAVGGMAAIDNLGGGSSSIFIKERLQRGKIYTFENCRETTLGNCRMCSRHNIYAFTKYELCTFFKDLEGEHFKNEGVCENFVYDDDGFHLTEMFKPNNDKRVFHKKTDISNCNKKQINNFKYSLRRV